MSFITSPGIIVPPLTAGGVAYGTGGLAKMNNAGTAGQALLSAGAGVPVWADAAGSVVPPFTAGAVAYGTGTDVELNAAGTAGQVLKSAGVGMPFWATSTAGIPVTVPEGGTGLTTLTANNVILGNAASTPNFVAPGANGNVLQSDGSTWISGAGGITWLTKTTTYTANNGNYLFCDTSAAAFTITLPASPAINNTVYFQDAKGTFLTNPLTIDRNGQTIMGLSENMIAAINNVGFGLAYNGTTWRIF